MANNKFITNHLTDICETSNPDRLTLVSRLLFYIQKLYRNSEEIDYVVKRLLSGLYSNRKSARLGFSVSFCALIDLEFHSSVDRVFLEITKIKEKLKNDSKMLKTQTTIGELFTFLVLVKSNMVTSLSDAQEKLIIKRIVKCTFSKSSLNTIGMEVLLAYCRSLPGEKFRLKLWPAVQTFLQCGWERANPDIVLALITFHNNHPDICNKQFLSTFWKHKKLTSHKLYGFYYSIIVQSCVIMHPITHQVCFAILDIFIKCDHFTTFWTQVMEKLAGGNVSHRFLIFSLISYMLTVKRHNLYDVQVIFSDKILQLVITNLCKESLVLHSAARKLVQDLSSYINSSQNLNPSFSSDCSFVMIEKTIKFMSLQNNSGLNLLLYPLLNNLQTYKLKLLLTECFNYIDTDQNVESQKHFYNLLVHMMSLPNLSEKLQYKNLKFLFLNAAKLHTNNAFEVVSISSFTRSLSCVYKSSCSIISSSSRSKLLVRLANFILKKTSRDSGTNIYCVRHYELLSKILQRIKVLKKHDLSENISKDDSNHLSILQLFFLHMFFHIAAVNDLNSEDTEIVDELFACSNHIIPNQEIVSSTSIENNTSNLVEVVTELLVSLLARSSNHIRVAVITVFKLLVPFVNLRSVGLILDALTSSENLKLHDDKNYISVATNNENYKTDIDMDVTSSDEDGGVENESTEMSDLQLKADLKLALGNLAYDSDISEESNGRLLTSNSSFPSDLVDEKNIDSSSTDSFSDSETSSEALSVIHSSKVIESDVDDETMFKMDNAIAAIFRQKAVGDKKTQKDMKRQVTHFRIRLLELITELIKSDISPTLLIQLSVPLLKLQNDSYRDGEKQELVFALKKVLQNFYNTSTSLIKRKEFLTDPEVVIPIISELFHLSNRLTVSKMVDDVASMIVFLFKLCSKLPEKHRLLQILDEHLLMFLEQKSHVPLKFFEIILRRQSTFCFSSSIKILQHIAQSRIKPYLRIQLLDNLNRLIKDPQVRIEINVDTIGTFISQLKRVAIELLTSMEMSPYKSSNSKNTENNSIVTSLLHLVCSAFSVFGYDSFDDHSEEANKFFNSLRKVDIRKLGSKKSRQAFRSLLKNIDKTNLDVVDDVKQNKRKRKNVSYKEEQAKSSKMRKC